MESKQTCVLLLRASSKKAFIRQEEACRAFANERELEVCEVFREREKLQFKRRKALRWMSTYCRVNKDIDFVVAYKARSISLNNSELFLITRLLKKHKVDILFVKETPQSKF